MKLKTGVSSSFNNRDGSGSARSHHKGGTSMQTHPAVRVGFELRPWRPTASSSISFPLGQDIPSYLYLLFSDSGVVGSGPWAQCNLRLEVRLEAACTDYDPPTPFSRGIIRRLSTGSEQAAAAANRVGTAILEVQGLLVGRFNGP